MDKFIAAQNKFTFWLAHQSFNSSKDMINFHIQLRRTIFYLYYTIYQDIYTNI